MKMVDRHIGKCCQVFEGFAKLFRESEDYAAPNGHEGARELLQRWMVEARESETSEIEAFAAKLFEDIEVVAAAMVWPYSQGQTEGRINKLKLIKRSMYGRGKFDLLRQRVLYDTAS